MQEGGAVGYLAQYRGLRPPYSERYSDPVSYSGAAGGDRRVVSDLVTTFNHIESSKHSYPSNPRVSTSFKYAEGRVGAVLQAFDPLKPSDDGAASSNDIMVCNQQLSVIVVRIAHQHISTTAAGEYYGGQYNNLGG